MREKPTGWPETDEALAASLTRHGLTVDAVTRIIIAARPALMFTATPVADDLIPIGATKVGGRPDLPPGVTWPLRPAYANAAEMAQEAWNEATRLHLDAGLYDRSRLDGLLAFVRNQAASVHNWAKLLWSFARSSVSSDL